MSESAVDRLMKTRPQGSATAAAAEEEGGRFFSVLRAEGLVENFLELQFRNGLRSCFNYSDLQWFSWDPESGSLDLEFGGFLITIKGRGLYEGLFKGIKDRRVAWIKEADSEMQDHAGNDAFIEEITIIPPKEFSDEPES
jgi:hypothetical protein